jgi:dolichol-phosphate mannosyltransferase
MFWITPRAVRQDAAVSIPVDSRSYSFLLEIKYRAHRRGFRLAEVPIIFADRRLGQSKITRQEVLRSVWAVWAAPG